LVKASFYLLCSCASQYFCANKSIFSHKNYEFMKHFLLFISFCTFFSASKAQPFEGTYTKAYQTFGQGIKAMSPGHWAVGMRTHPAPNALYQDSLFVLLLNGLTQAQKEIWIDVPMGELMYISHIFPNNQGNVVLVIEESVCDVGSITRHIFCKDQDGETVWDMNIGLIDVGQVQNIWQDPDGNLTFNFYQQLMRINAQTGQVFWDADIDVDLALGFVGNDFDLMALKDGKLQYWRQTGNLPNAQYTLDEEIPADGIQLDQIHPLSNGEFLAFNLNSSSNPRFFSIKKDFNLSIKPLFPDLNLSGVVDYYLISGERLLLLYDNKIELRDKTGTLISESEPFAPGLVGKKIALNFDEVLVLGEDHYFPNPTSTDPYEAATSLWIRGFELPSLEGPSLLEDAAIIDVEQSMPVDVFSSGGGLPYLNIAGGRFSVKLANFGENTLQEAYVNVYPGKSGLPICYEDYAQQRHYTDLGLEPGQSIWLDFGSVFGQGLTDPSQLCFFSSAPNQWIDRNRDNDHTCFSYVTSTDLPICTAASRFVLSPNPAEDWLNIALFREKNYEGLEYQIRSILGPVLISGRIGIEKTLKINLASLPSGRYILNIPTEAAQLFSIQR
jgi:Secretion system C-terminal sorting domain